MVRGAVGPDMAMAGGSEPQNLLQALNFAQEWIQANYNLIPRQGRMNQTCLDLKILLGLLSWR